jgi:hypothetical protein
LAERTSWAGAAGAAALIAILAASCGSSSNGLTSKTPAQILAAAVSATSAATSYEIGGTGTFADGVTSIDFKVAGSNLNGSFVLAGSTVDVMQIAGNVYINAPAAYYVFEGETAARAALLDHVWVEATAGSKVASDFFTLSGLLDISSDLSSAEAVTSGGTGSVGGQSVVILEAADGTGVDIATSGPAYPVQITTTGSSAAVYTLSDWDSVAAFTPPPNPILIPSTSS